MVNYTEQAVKEITMKFIIVFVALFALALAAPAEVEVLKNESDVGPESFQYA